MYMTFSLQTLMKIFRNIIHLQTSTYNHHDSNPFNLRGWININLTIKHGFLPICVQERVKFTFEKLMHWSSLEKWCSSLLPHHFPRELHNKLYAHFTTRLHHTLKRTDIKHKLDPLTKHFNYKSLFPAVVHAFKRASSLHDVFHCASALLLEWVSHLRFTTCLHLWEVSLCFRTTFF